MRSVTWMGAVACAVGLTVAADAQRPADPAQPPARPVSDPEFVILAASGGMYEVKSSELAKANASSDEVKKFAEHMIADHGKADKELKAAAAKANLGLPVQMLPDHQRMIAKLSGLKGAEFDREYIAQQKMAHAEDLALFTGAAKGARDPGLRAFAEKTLPVIKEHQKHLMELDGKGGRDKEPDKGREKPPAKPEKDPAKSPDGNRP